MNIQQFYNQLYAWLLTMGPRILLGIAIVFIGMWLVKIIRTWMNHHLMQRDINSSVRPFLISLIVTTLRILLVLAVLQVIGIQMTIFAAAIGAFGVAAGLALSGTLQNFTSGVIILLLKPFKVGDNIKAQGEEGRVSSIQIFYTVVTTFDNRTIIFPNSKLSNEVIINLSREGKRRLDIEIKFKFLTPFTEAKKSIDASIESIAGLLKDPERRIGVLSIDPDGYKVLINIWAPAHGYEDAKLALQERIIEDLKGAGIIKID